LTHDHSRSGGHVLIAGICEDDIVLVREPYRPGPKWKLPGGTRDIDETPEEAARREFEEETGVSLEGIPLHLLMERPKTNRHTGVEFQQYLFAAALPPPLMQPLKEAIVQRSGDNGEDLEATAFNLSTIDSMHDFFEPHLDVISVFATKQAL